MSLLLLLIPLLSTGIISIVGRYMGILYTKLLSIISMMIVCTLLYILYIYILYDNNTYHMYIAHWFIIDGITVDYSFTIDLLSITMLLPIITISTMVHIYSYAYMDNDPHEIRFYIYIGGFTTFMVWLVIVDNYLLLFIAWEYIGIASFLLIGYWYNSISVVKSSISALLINKVGDVSFIILLLLLYKYYGTYDYSIIYSIVPYINSDINIYIIITIICAACAKSAQYGLHNWLIWAMAGPTPVSVLLHAATLVIAGIYLLIRSSYIIEYTPIMLLIILWIGAITTVTAGIIALYTNDIKKIIALSTMGQLGMMMISIGISSYNMALYHILCHSIYKALLFMTAGSIIHSVINENQDIRHIGINTRYMPITYSSICIAMLSLCAFPYMTGYYSKDIIIEHIMGHYIISGYIVYWLSILSATCTTIYSIKIIYYVFYNIPMMPKYYYYYIKETHYILYIPIIILCLLSIYTGYILKDIYIMSGYTISGIYMHPNHNIMIDADYGTHTIYKLIPFIIMIISIIVVFIIYEYYSYNIHNAYNNTIWYNWYRLYNNRLYYDQIINNIIIRSLLSLSHNILYNIERGIITYIGPYGIWLIINKLSYRISLLSTGIIYHYALYLLSLLLYIIIIYISLYTNYTLLYDIHIHIMILLSIIIWIILYTW